MAEKNSRRAAKPVKRSAEDRRRAARKQTRTFRTTAAGPSQVEKKARPRKQRSRPTLPAFNRGRIVAVVAALMAVALIVFGFGDAHFYVNGADITGVRYGSVDEVYRQAGIDGFSIFWVNANQAEQRIEALATVKSAEVLTSLPNRVRIVIDEREPVALWQVNGQAMWVDEQGITMPVSSQAADLPVFRDLDGSSIAADGSVDPSLTGSIRELARRLPEINEFAYDRYNGLQFRLPSGTLVLLGKPQGIVQRLDELMVLRGSLASLGQMPTEIDWRFNDGYTLKLQ